MRTLARWIPVTGAILVVGCSKPDSETTTRMGTNPSTEPKQPSATATVSPTTRPTPVTSPDLDVPGLQKVLRCGGPQHKDACRVLEEFGGGGRWQLRVPSGEGRWAGYAYSIENGKERAETVLLSAREVPTNTIGPGDLPIRVGTGSLPDSMRAAGTKLAGALARDDTVPKSNSALNYVKTWTSQQEYTAVPTTGNSVRLVAERETYVRQGKGQKIVVVQVNRGTSNPGGGEGSYLELWPLSW